MMPKALEIAWHSGVVSCAANQAASLIVKGSPSDAHTLLQGSPQALGLKHQRTPATVWQFGVAHAPLMHERPPPHTTPHAPQFVLLFCVLVSQPFATLPSQLAKPALHEATVHMPDEHALLPLATAAQVVPQAPQLDTLDCVLVSQPLALLPSQLPKPALQLAMPHAPIVHEAAPLLGVAQTVPHAPQLDRLLLRLTSQPLDATRSQSAKPELHESTRHAPDTHTGAAFGSAHAAPHAPQLAGSNVVFVHVPEHTVRPAPQVGAHEPAEHTCPAGHTVPHEPQLPLSLCRSRHVPLQFVWPAAHTTRHVPVTHCCPPAHTVPHAPQFCEFVCRSRHVPLQLV
jgi:hypothetical protein